jgi:hypothetical protein
MTLASVFLLSITTITTIKFLIVPNLQRLHLQAGLTLFDYGFYGFYPTRHYASVEYKSPDVEIAQWDAKCSQDYVFMAPHGNAVDDPAAMILDSRGNLVWMMPFFDGAQDFRVQEYLGNKYLTYWHGRGSWSMVCSPHSSQVLPFQQVLLSQSTYANFRLARFIVHSPIRDRASWKLRWKYA